MYPPPKNGALACNYLGGDPTCAVMCKGAYDFDFNPPMLYYCYSGQWSFYSQPGISHSSQLPWPDCSSKLITSVTYQELTTELKLQFKNLRFNNLHDNKLYFF